MKVKALTDCNGYGYEDFNAGEERNIRKDIAELLIDFGYAEKVKKQDTSEEDGKENSEGEPEGSAKPIEV